MGLQIQVLNASTSREIDAAFATFARERPDAIFVGQEVFFVSRRVQLANMAARHAVPMTSGSRDVVEVGGLIKSRFEGYLRTELLSRLRAAGLPE